MYLQSLHLQEFRNYEDRRVTFDAPKTILLGDNAQGKTNLLEAIALLATLKSRRTSRDRDLVREGQVAGSIEGTIARDLSTRDLSIVLRANGRRTVATNGQTVRRQLDALGHFNAVQFCSLDLALVRGGPSLRRDWLDGVLVQLEPIYASLLQQYDRVLKQRNALLRQQAKQMRESLLAATGNFPLALGSEATDTPQGSASRNQHDGDRDNLALWDAQLSVAGTRLIRRRARAIARLAPLAAQWQAVIGRNSEQLDVRYQSNVAIEDELIASPAPEAASQIQQLFLAQLQAKSTAEHFQGTTLVGPHRDDIALALNGNPARQYGSQGQQRTLAIALKLAELQAIESVVGEPPVLLLDDVLAELDLTRQNQLLDALDDRVQTFVTTTHLGAFDGRWLRSASTIAVRAGQLEFA